MHRCTCNINLPLTFRRNFRFTAGFARKGDGSTVRAKHIDICLFQDQEAILRACMLINITVITYRYVIHWSITIHQQTCVIDSVSLTWGMLFIETLEVSWRKACMTYMQHTLYIFNICVRKWGDTRLSSVLCNRQINLWVFINTKPNYVLPISFNLYFTIICSVPNCICKLLCSIWQWTEEYHEGIGYIQVRNVRTVYKRK